MILYIEICVRPRPGRPDFPRGGGSARPVPGGLSRSGPANIMDPSGRNPPGGEGRTTDSRDWLILRTIAEEASLSKAALRLHISQPSLTQRLHKLEDEFDAIILNRFSNGVSFTENGEIILRYAEEMLGRLDEVKRRIRHSYFPVAGHVRIGVSTTFAKHMLAPILRGFKARFPEAEVLPRTGSSTLELPDMLRSGEADVIVRRGGMDWAGGQHVLFEEPKGILSASDIDFDRLLGETCILDQSSAITGSNRLLLDWWEAVFGVRPELRILEVNSIEACLEMVSQGLGWTFLPRIHRRGRKNLRFHPLAWPDGRPIVQTTVLLYRPESLESRPVLKFVEYVLSSFPGCSPRSPCGRSEP